MVTCLASLAVVAFGTVDPAPVTTGGGGGSSVNFGDILPYVAGPAGALVVLLLILFLFATDRITTVGSVKLLREADNNRFSDVVVQRDNLTAALERANAAMSLSASNQQQTLVLLHDLVPVRPTPRRRAAP